MDNEGRLFSQVAAEAGVSSETAMVACYLLNLSRKGKSMGEAATLMRKERCEVRDYARDWGISFTDYVAAAHPLSLTWRKVKRGRWELSLDGMLIAAANSDGSGTGGYIAKRVSHDVEHTGSSAIIAITRASAEIERRSVEIFGLDDIRILIEHAGGLEQIAPASASNVDKLRVALAA